MQLTIPRIEPARITGDGADPAWDALPWLTLTRVGDGAADYRTRARIGWSDEGIHGLIDCEDTRLSCALTEDFAELYREDVVEMFLWPHEPQKVYFEYEVSPLGCELPLMVTNPGGESRPWLPFLYEGERRVRKAVAVRGGEAKPGAAVAGWSAEWCIPFDLMGGMADVPPRAGSRWRGNVYRIDYDADPPSHWALSPATGDNFHRIDGFATFIFAGD